VSPRLRLSPRARRLLETLCVCRHHLLVGCFKLVCHKSCHKRCHIRETLREVAAFLLELVQGTEAKLPWKHHFLCRNDRLALGDYAIRLMLQPYSAADKKKVREAGIDIDQPLTQLPTMQTAPWLVPPPPVVSWNTAICSALTDNFTFRDLRVYNLRPCVLILS
jgi:hypothetical protein